jgi:MFS transporter, PAT family, beta-lactamase induction signal transducer AmpG
MATQALPMLPAKPFALTEHRNLRLATLFLLYFAQGLPFGFIEFAMLAWLAQNGVSAAAIGSVLAALALPWTFKLAYGFIMDRYAFLPMGRRRPWIISGQLGLVAAFAAMATANPSPAQIGLIAGLAFVIGLSSATQDVAVDGLAVDILPEDEIEKANGYMFGGQALGMAAGGGVGGFLIAYYSLAAAAMTMAVLVATILILVLLLRERPGERLLPWTAGQASQSNLDIHLAAFMPIIRNLFRVMFTRQTLTLMPAMVAVCGATGIFLGLAPLFSANILDWEKSTYSGWASTASFVAGLAAIILFGHAASWLGARRSFILCAAATAAIALAMLALKAEWSNSAVFICSIFAFKAMFVLRGVTGGALSMRLCAPAVAATQFAVFMAIANLGRAIGSASLGWLDSLGGIPAMFAAMAVCSLIAAGFALAAKVGR